MGHTVMEEVDDVVYTELSTKDPVLRTLREIREKVMCI